MGNRGEEIRRRWQEVKESGRLHNLSVFLGFVVISALFWFLMALNDSVSDNMDVRLSITNVPDSVTFINEPPVKIHVNVRDKGTSLLRSTFMHIPTARLDFNEFASDGIFRVSGKDLASALKSAFGSSATVSALSVDSLRIAYTYGKGKRVPVVVSADVTASSGYVIAGRPVSSPSSVYVYSTSLLADTLTRVFTENIVKRNLSETTTISVKLKPVAGSRIVPSEIEVTVPVEALVRKSSMISVEVRNVPEGESVLLFPSRVEVAYFLPMSRFSEANPGIDVEVDYNDIKRIYSERLPLYVSKIPDGIDNVELVTDSVEYTLVKD